MKEFDSYRARDNQGNLLILSVNKYEMIISRNIGGDRMADVSADFILKPLGESVLEGTRPAERRSFLKVAALDGIVALNEISKFTWEKI